MYRNNDLTAAFGRAQLAKLDGYLATIKENVAALDSGLGNVPGLILPGVTEGAVHNWYNYVIRFDMKALGHEHDAAEYRNKLVDAINAEGVNRCMADIHTSRNDGLPGKERVRKRLSVELSERGPGGLFC